MLPDTNADSGGPGLSVTPCGTIFEYISQSEAEFLYEEIFERNSYLQNGIQVNDGDIVVDLGANIGLFSLFLMSRFNNLKIIAIEPIPQIFDVLERNLSCGSSGHTRGHTTICCNYAAGRVNESSSFVYIPSLPGESTRYPEEQLERRSILEGMHPVQEDGAKSLPPLLQVQVNQNENHLVTCEVRTLSSILQSHLEFIKREDKVRIDLLKIDVEGDELNILLGLKMEYLANIYQIVIEVYDVEERLCSVVQFLRDNSYTVEVKQQVKQQQR
jgi:FkbM family methyltransferase